MSFLGDSYSVRVYTWLTNRSQPSMRFFHPDAIPLKMVVQKRNRQEIFTYSFSPFLWKVKNRANTDRSVRKRPLDIPEPHGPFYLHLH